MSFVASSLRDSEQHRNALRPIAKGQSEDGRARQLRAATSMERNSSDIFLDINSIGNIQLTDNDGLYGPLLILSSKLETLCRSTNSLSKVSFELLNK